MLKYVESAVTFAEFPDEIALAINLSLCPNHCEGCSESYLAGDIGTELTETAIDYLIAKNSGISLVGFMGGDNDHASVIKLAEYIHQKYHLKVGMYSGKDEIDLKLASAIDYYKVGRWIAPKGDLSEWHKISCGPIEFPFSNQKMYKCHDGVMTDITYKFRQNAIGNYSRYII